MKKFEDMNLTVVLSLRRAGIQSAEDIAKKSYDELVAIPGIGRNRIDYIHDFMVENGYRVAGFDTPLLFEKG